MSNVTPIRPGAHADLPVQKAAVMSAQLQGLSLALDLLDEVRAEVARQGLGAWAWRASPAYQRLVGRYLKRARHAGPDIENAFTELLRQGAERLRDRRAEAR